MKFTTSISIPLWLMTCVISTSTGCSSSNATSPQIQGSDRLEIYGKKLSVHSSPTRVAEVALLAIQKNDLETLASLVAEDRVKQDLTSITNGKSQFSKWTDQGKRRHHSRNGNHHRGLEPATYDVHSKFHSDDKHIMRQTEL